MLVYLKCPTIYFNLHFFPCLLGATAANWGFVRWQGPLSVAILFVLIVEIVTDLGVFWVLGNREAIAPSARIRGAVAWWSLTLNNALSTLSALIGQKIQYEITEKRSCSHSGGVSGVQALRETLVGAGILVLAVLPWTLGIGQGIATLALAILSMLPMLAGLIARESAGCSL